MRKLILLIGLVILCTGCTEPHKDPPTVNYINPKTLSPCEPPTQEILDWISGHIYNGVPYTATRSKMVKVGEGNTPGTDWWVVAYLSGHSGETTHQTLLTNTPSTQEISNQEWILITDTNWDTVSWSDEMISIGKASLWKAISCLPKPTQPESFQCETADLYGSKIIDAVHVVFQEHLIVARLEYPPQSTVDHTPMRCTVRRDLSAPLMLSNHHGLHDRVPRSHAPTHSEQDQWSSVSRPAIPGSCARTHQSRMQHTPIQPTWKHR